MRRGDLAELVALAVCQAAMGICSDRRFLDLVAHRLALLLPHPGQAGKRYPQ